MRSVWQEGTQQSLVSRSLSVRIIVYKITSNLNDRRRFHKVIQKRLHTFRFLFVSIESNDQYSTTLRVVRGFQPIWDIKKMISHGFIRKWHNHVLEHYRPVHPIVPDLPDTNFSSIWNTEETHRDERHASWNGKIKTRPTETLQKRKQNKSSRHQKCEFVVVVQFQRYIFPIPDFREYHQSLRCETNSNHHNCVPLPR